jgi:hypothetical protein
VARVLRTRQPIEHLITNTANASGIEALEAASERMKAVRAVRLTLTVGVVLLVAAGAVTLTRSPPRVVRVNTTTVGNGPTTIGAVEVCQADEQLPADVSAVRLSLKTYFGPAVRVRALRGSQVLTEGRRGPGWTGTSVTVPVVPLSHAASHVKLCFHVGPNSELVVLAGFPTAPQEAAVYSTGEGLGGRVGVEYLAAGQGSWWSRILTVARHIGIGHALGGTWVVLLIAVLVSAAGLLAVGLTLRELR